MEEQKEKKPDIPPNYVTLQQLKERWIKEQQQRKQQEQQVAALALDQLEEEGEKDEQNEQRSIHEEQQKQEAEGGGRTGSSRIKPPRRDYRRRNLGSRAYTGGANPEITDLHVTVSAAIAEGRSCSRGTLTEAKSAELVDKGKKNKKKKKKNRWKRKKNDNNKEEEEREELGREAHAPPIKTEKENVPARRFGKVGEMRMEFQQKMNSVAAESDRTVVGIERKTEVVEEWGDPVTDIEQKFGDLSVEKTKRRFDSQIKVVNNWSSRANRGYNGVYNRGNRENGGYNSGFNRGIRGGYGGFSRGNRGYRGYNAVNGQNRGGRGGFGFPRKQGVWVRKEEAADGGDDSMDRSSSVSLQELQ